MGDIRNGTYYIEVVRDATFNIRAMFYLVLPSETSPEYVDENTRPRHSTMSVYIVLFMVIEIAACLILRKNYYQFNDSVSSVANRVYAMIPGLFNEIFQFTWYVYIYENHRLFTPNVHSVWTWIVTIVGVDFCWYWFHRSAHEINIFWAIHQAHHSSEFLNFASGLRLSAYADFIISLFYLPLALFIPPGMFWLHSHLNMYFQVFVHTAFVIKLGPLEWVMNTPTHHRIHHGRNPYCIDKNYAGVFIIWDRLFGTFAAEKQDEPVRFGLVKNIKTFDFFYIEFSVFCEIFWKIIRILRNKNYSCGTKVKGVFKSCFYGPGWSSKKPELRLGDPNDLPPIEPVVIPFNPQIPTWQNLYCAFHLALIGTPIILLIPGYWELVDNLAIVTTAFLMTACSIGYIFNAKPFAPYFEMARCILFASTMGQLKIVSRILMSTSIPIFVFQIVYSVCVLPWVLTLIIPLVRNKYFTNAELKQAVAV